MQRKVVPFKRWHVAWLGDTLEAGAMNLDDMTLDQLEAGNSHTGLVDGEVVCCAGTVQQWSTRHIAWALLGSQAPHNMKWITQEVRAALSRVPGRIELTVRADFPAGQKWAGMLGFHVETPLMPKYGPEQEDHVGFVRLN